MPKLHQKMCTDTSFAQDRQSQVKVKGQGQMGQKLDFSDGVPHNFFFYQQIAFKLHQKLCIETSLAQDRQFQVKVKGQGQIGQKLDFSDGVQHKFFFYKPIAPKLHQKVCNGISLNQEKENSRSRPKVKVKWAITRPCTAQPFHFPTDCVQIPPEYLHRHQPGSR